MLFSRSLLVLVALLLVALIPACAASPAPSPTAQNTAPTTVVVGAQTPGPGATNASLLEDGSLFRLTAANPSQGAADAPVTIVMFMNPQCKHSATAFHSLESLRSRYPLPTVRFVWKSFPITQRHPESRAATEAALAVHAIGGSDAFFCYLRLLFDNRSSLGPELYRSAANQCKVPTQALEAEIASGRPARQVDADLELSAAVQIAGTPTLFINGLRVEGAEEPDTYAKLIEAESLGARRSLAAGTPPQELHAVRVRANFQIGADQAEAPEPVDNKVYRVPVGKSPVLGSPQALITIVVFSDFECPYCRLGANSIAAVRKEYGDKVRFVFKHYPLNQHLRAEPASQFAAEARAQQGDAGFWRAHDALFASAPRLENADFDSLAKSLKLNQAAVQSAVTSHKHAAAIEADIKLAESLRVEATPAFYVNGRKLLGAQPLEVFRALIQEVLPAAEALTRKGIPANRVYDEIVKEGVGP